MAVDGDSFVATRIVLGRHEIKTMEKVSLGSNRLRITVPNPGQPDENITFTINTMDIVKLICHLEVNPTLVFHITTKCIDNIWTLLHIERARSIDERWVVIETESLTDALKEKVKALVLYRDEISHEDIQQFVKYKTRQPKVKKIEEKPNVLKKQLSKKISIDDTNTSLILQYPSSGVGGISITIPDFQCLAVDEFLNDVIINFYLQFITREVLTDEQEKKTHIFNTFFYEALSNASPQNETDSDLSIAQKRYERVEKWTKHVNLFEKDFIIVPINQHSHWFLAIICFPGAIEFDTKSDTRISMTKQYDSNDEGSGDDADKEDKRPCILIFDSMSGSDRKVTQILRDYILCEYQSKMENAQNHTFNAKNMPGHSVKVPRQQNTSDCGLFMLHYIEQFFKDPLTSFKIPIKNLEDWFEVSAVTKKRRDIVDLIKEQINRYGRNNITIEDLPKIQLPE